MMAMTRLFDHPSGPEARITGFTIAFVVYGDTAILLQPVKISSLVLAGAYPTLQRNTWTLLPKMLLVVHGRG